MLTSITKERVSDPNLQRIHSILFYEECNIKSLFVHLLIIHQENEGLSPADDENMTSCTTHEPSGLCSHQLVARHNIGDYLFLLIGLMKVVGSDQFGQLVCKGQGVGLYISVQQLHSKFQCYMSHSYVRTQVLLVLELVAGYRPPPPQWKSSFPLCSHDSQLVLVYPEQTMKSRLANNM